MIITLVKIGRKHPDQVVETASMSSVEPPDVFYDLAIPDSSIDQCKLSALQLESIVYASQQHEHTLPDGSRAGFLIGDGAGVGKVNPVSVSVTTFFRTVCKKVNTRILARG